MYRLFFLLSVALFSQAGNTADLFDLYRAKQDCLGKFENSEFWNDIITKETLSQNDLDILKDLILAKDNRGNTIIHHLAAKGQINKIILLYKNIGNIGLETPNNFTWTPATTASIFGHTKCFEKILKLQGVYFPALKNIEK